MTKREGIQAFPIGDDSKRGQETRIPEKLLKKVGVSCGTTSPLFYIQDLDVNMKRYRDMLPVSSTGPLGQLLLQVEVRPTIMTNGSNRTVYYINVQCPPEDLNITV